VPLQEKAQETEKYMSDLTAEIDKVRLEKSKLEERNQLLETVLSLSKQDRPLPTKGILQLVPPHPLCSTIPRLVVHELESVTIIVTMIIIVLMC